MSDVVISVENLSKCYLIGHQGPKERYHSLRDTLSLHAKNLARRTVDTFRGRQMLQGDSVEEFWALNDVSFEVKQGEVLGIIGRNGAGKSTLLKVLSRITEPTRGRVIIDGRVASLLEVGTGFHPELTGRENIFLNGAILGMTKREIKTKFDEIVDFAGVEKFLDTPVKRYSSGMYVRLAFAVAAHLEPEILVVDEVLAVGDAEFQKKCMGKMQDVAGAGRTVLFVSHNMNAVSTLCTRSILLGNGEIKKIGDPGEIIEAYISSNHFERIRSNESSGKVSCVIVNVESGDSVLTFSPTDDVFIDFEFAKPLKFETNIAFTVYNSNGLGIISGIYDDTGEKIPPLTSHVRFPLPARLFNPGDYRIEGVLLDDCGHVIERQESFTFFSVHRSNQFDLQGHKPAGAMRLDYRLFSTTQ